MKTTISQWERIYEAPEIEIIKMETAPSMQAGSQPGGGGMDDPSVEDPD